jgi:hypothetical protein
MRRVLCGSLAAATLALVGARADAGEGVIVVDVAPGPLDRKRLRAEVARELAAVVVAPEDPRAGGAARKLGVVARTAERTLTVTFHGGSGAGITRTVSLPSDVRRAETIAVLLAGNLARDEAAEILAALRHPTPTTATTSATATPTAPSTTTANATPPAITAPPALAALEDEARAYEGGARDYRDTLTAILRASYATKKKAILGGLDEKLAAAESDERRARETAIARYEAFLATWHGSAATAEVVDATLRLAALYDAAGRHDDAARLLDRLAAE